VFIELGDVYRHSIVVVVVVVVVHAQTYRHDTTLHTDVHNVNCYKFTTQEAASAFLQTVYVSTKLQTVMEKLTKYVRFQLASSLINCSS
jgi:hypothetical protein